MRAPISGSDSLTHWYRTFYYPEVATWRTILTHVFWSWENFGSSSWTEDSELTLCIAFDIGSPFLSSSWMKGCSGKVSARQSRIWGYNLASLLLKFSKASSLVFEGTQNIYHPLLHLELQGPCFLSLMLVSTAASWSQELWPYWMERVYFLSCFQIGNHALLEAYQEKSPSSPSCQIQ